MRKTIIAALAATSLLALAGCKQTTTSGNEAAENAAVPASVAAATIDGTWKADVDSVQFDQKPDELLLQGGQYSCKSCVPPITVAADGAFHAITAPYADSLAVKVVDDHNVVRTSKKAGRQVGETKLTVSADGNTLTGSFTDTSSPTGQAGKGTFVETRVGPAPAGAHAVSGQWKPAKLQDFNAEALTFTFKTEGDIVHMSSGTGQSYDAKFGGPDVPIKNDIAGTTASVKKTGDNSFQEIDKRGGKVVGVFDFSVSADGKGHGSYENKEDGSKVTYTATRQ
jgi:carbon monoxide dehydrogenase subunit G